MKKILGFLGAAVLTSTAASGVVACDTNPKVDLSTFGIDPDVFSFSKTFKIGDANALTGKQIYQMMIDNFFANSGVKDTMAKGADATHLAVAQVGSDKQDSKMPKDAFSEDKIASTLAGKTFVDKYLWFTISAAGSNGSDKYFINTSSKIFWTNADGR